MTDQPLTFPEQFRKCLLKACQGQQREDTTDDLLTDICTELG
jgi:hypothetical protein